MITPTSGALGSDMSAEVQLLDITCVWDEERACGLSPSAVSSVSVRVTEEQIIIKGTKEVKSL